MYAFVIVYLSAIAGGSTFPPVALFPTLEACQKMQRQLTDEAGAVHPDLMTLGACVPATEKR